ncbi:extracellular solute-binding protein [Aliamphritea spongicola]|nr:extracellular solute-binding protein [Aliamphritea spongicola]
MTYFHSSQYINDLANGDICVAIGWSGDVLQAAARAEESNNGVKVAYSIPKEGTAVWFDMLAIPADAKNTDKAHEMLNYLLRPEVIAGISNYVAYANANKASTSLIDEAIVNDETIYPPEDVKQNLFSLKVLPKKIDRVLTRLWTDVKANR